MLSVTITSWLQEAVFPALSVTVHVTTVVPRGNVAGALFVTLATPQLSVVTGVPMLPAYPHPLLVNTFAVAGQVMVGNTLSITVITWLQVEVLPEASATVQTTVVEPALNVNGALLLIDATLQLSLTTGIPIDPEYRHPMFGDVVIEEGHVISGAVLSEMTTNCVHEAALPFASTTVQTTDVVPTGKLAGALFVMLAIEQLSVVTGVPMLPT